MAHLECARRGAGRRCAHGGKPASMRSGERGRWQDGVADRPVGGMRRRPAPGYRRLPCAIAFRPTSSSIFQFTDRPARERPTVYFQAFALIYAPCKSISTHTATHAVIHAAARDAAGLADTGSGLNKTGIRAAGTIPSASSHRRSDRQAIGRARLVDLDTSRRQVARPIAAVLARSGRVRFGFVPCRCRRRVAG